MKKDYWDITNRPHTKLKLEIFNKYLNSWCSIFEGQYWARDIYIVDCFAGRGFYRNGEDTIDGSPLIALKKAKVFQDKFRNRETKNKSRFKIKCIFIEKNKRHCKELEKILKSFDDVDCKIVCGDFNQEIGSIIKEIGTNPALFFIDPFGIKELKKEGIIPIIKKEGAKDILLNYINEGVVRIGGLVKKCLVKRPEDITVKEIKTVKILEDLLGEDGFLNCVDKKEKEILKYYIENIIKIGNDDKADKDKLEVIVFDMPYPHKSDTIYYLLFASRNKNALKIVRQVYAKSKEINFDGQRSLFRGKKQEKLNKDFKI